VPGISPRRSACDRCRGQKLRCLRDRDEKRCRRCVRADSECVTSSIFRMRNYVSDDAAMRPRLHHSHQLQEQPRFSTANSTATVAAAASTTETIDLTALLADLVPISMFANHAAGLARPLILANLLIPIHPRQQLYLSICLTRTQRKLPPLRLARLLRLIVWRCGAV
jgi:hypothetical protein